MCCSDSDRVISHSLATVCLSMELQRTALTWPPSLLSDVPCLDHGRQLSPTQSCPVAGKLFVPAKIYSSSTFLRYSAWHGRVGFFLPYCPQQSCPLQTKQHQTSNLSSRIISLDLVAFPLDFIFLLKICCVKRQFCLWQSVFSQGARRCHCWR